MIFLLFACQAVQEKRLISDLKDSEDGYQLFLRADKLFQDNKYNAAKDLYQEYLRQFPSEKFSSVAVFKTGLIYKRAGNTAEAENFFNRLLQEYPQSPFIIDATLELLDIASLNDEYDKVRQQGEVILNEYQQLLTDAQKLRLYLLLAESGRATGFPADAFHYYYLVWKLSKETQRDKLPGDLDADLNADLKNVMRLLTSLEIEQFLNELKDIDDEVLRSYLIYQQGEALAIEEKYDEALNKLTAFIEKYPDHEYRCQAEELIEVINQRSLFEPYTIGCLLPLSGAYAIYGNRALHGIELALHLATVSQEPLPFKIIIKDTASDPAQAVRGVQELVEARVGAILGPITTAAAAASAAQDRGVPLITFTQKDKITDTGDYIFRNFITPAMQVKTLVAFATDFLGVNRFAILYPSEKYGTRFMSAFWDEVIAKGGKVVGVEAYEPSKTDFIGPIKKLVGLYYKEPLDLKAKSLVFSKTAIGEKKHFGTDFVDLDMLFINPVKRYMGALFLDDTDLMNGDISADKKELEPVVDFKALFIPDSPKVAGLIIPQLAFYDVKDIYLLGTNLWHSKNLIKMSRQYIQGAVLVDAFSRKSLDPQVKKFVGSYEAAFSAKPGIIEALAFDSAQLLFKILADENIQLKREIKNQLIQTVNFKGVTGLTSFQQNGDVDKNLSLFRIKGSRFIKIDWENTLSKKEQNHTEKVE